MRMIQSTFGMRSTLALILAGASVQACNETPIIGSYSEKLSGKPPSSESRSQNSSDDDTGVPTNVAAADSTEKDSAEKSYRDSCNPAGAGQVDDKASGRIDVRVCTSKDSVADSMKGPSDVKAEIAGKESQTVVASKDPSSPTQTAQISIPLLESANLIHNGKGLIGALVIERKSADQFSVFLGGASSSKVSVADKKILVKISGPSVIQAIRFKLLAPSQVLPKIQNLDRKKAKEFFGKFVDELDRAAGAKKVCIDDGCDGEDEQGGGNLN